MDHDEADFEGMPLDKTTVAQELLNIASKQRSNLFPWNGQFSPQLIEVLLRAYAPKHGMVLDPFAGSGTVLSEAGRLSLPVVGVEINPAACTMARTYCLMNLSVVRREVLVDQLEAALQECLPDQGLSLFRTAGTNAADDVKAGLIAIHLRLSDEATRSLLEVLIVLVDFYRHVSDEMIFATWSQLKARVLSLPESGAPLTLFNCDARRVPLPDGSADFVVTSPPYINVFNYHQQYRRSVEALGWDVLTVARSEIGSNRKYRGNRFLTVVQYCLDMTDVLRELHRVCREGARVVMIVGRESNVRKTRFFNGAIMAALATRCTGHSFVSRQERVFMNRFGEQIVEDLLHFQVGAAPGAEGPRTIAREVLTRARRRTPAEALGDLEDALRLADEVQASPIYQRETASARSNDRGETRVKS